MYITKAEQRLIYLRSWLREAQNALHDCRVNGRDTSVVERNVLFLLTRVYYAQETVRREHWNRHMRSCERRAELLQVAS
jgi:hypothetical protein